MEQVQKKRDQIITRDQEQPPLVFGPKRIHYLYSAVLSQIHLTLVSVLQGIVFGVLLISIPLPTAVAWPTVYYYLLNHYFYIPYGISAIVIIIIWMQFVEVTMFLFWPLSMMQAMLVFLLTLCEVIAFREIGSLPIWLAGLGCTAIVGGWITRRNLILDPKEIYESTEELQGSFKIFFESNRKTSKMYFMTGSIILILGLTFSWLINRFPLLIPYISWGIIFFMSVCLFIIVRMDLYARKQWLKHAIENSDLIVSPYGVVMYASKNKESQNAK